MTAIVNIQTFYVVNDATCVHWISFHSLCSSSQSSPYCYPSTCSVVTHNLFVLYTGFLFEWAFRLYFTYMCSVTEYSRWRVWLKIGYRSTGFILSSTSQMVHFINLPKPFILL